MNILGIHYGHGAGTSLFKDNKLIAAVSEERFTKKKNDQSFPINSIKYCLKNIKNKRPDLVCLANKQFFFEDCLHQITNITKEEDLKLQEDYFYPLFYKGIKVNISKILKPIKDQYPKYYWKNAPKNKSVREFTADLQKIIANEIGIDVTKVINIEHHTCHANYAYYSSPFKKGKSLVFTIDGVGDYGINATISEGNNGKLTRFYKTKNFFLGRIYSYMTLLMGMKRLEHEFKVMGLAPYGEKKFDLQVYKVFRECLKFDGYEVKFDKKPKDAFFHFEKKLRGKRFDVIAHCLQKWVEDMLIEWVTRTIKIKKINRIAMGGGVALNAKAIGKILDIKSVKSVWVPGVAGDESNCIGSAVEKIKQNKFFDLKSLYFGFDADQDELIFIKKIIKDKKKYYTLKYNSKKVAEMLANGKVFGRCVGKMEFGPRSLGNRAIIANPKNFEIKKKINNMIKKRDFWMPFAPTVLDKFSKKYLKNTKKFSSPFMSVAYKTTKIGYENLKAGCHDADETARAQILSKKNNPSYYELIDNFSKITNCGALLNTSFNLHGSPIVENLEDALKVLNNSGLDGLLTKNYIILKKIKT